MRHSGAHNDAEFNARARLVRLRIQWPRCPLCNRTPITARLEQSSAGKEDDSVNGFVFFRTHLGKYLTVNGDGEFKGDATEAGAEETFAIEAQPDGRWAIKSAKYGWYAGGAGEDLSAFVEEITEDKLWTVDLAMHPQICIRGVQRKRYIHLSDDRSSLTTDEDIPWGDDAVCELHFNRAERAYNLLSCNGQYLGAGGKLSDSKDGSNDFTIEFQKGGRVAFKNKSNQKYLTSLGATGLCKATKSGAGADEIYQFENSYPQISLRANNGQLVSIKGGIECAANQGGALTDKEIFQLEPLGGDQWFVKAHIDKLWTLVDGAVHSAATPPGPDEQVDAAGNNAFTVEFDGPNVMFRAANGNYLSTKMNKYIKADTATPDDSCVFTWTLVNRPRLILRGEFGFINTMPSGLLECNKSSPEVYNLTVTDGKAAISAQNGKFWKITETGVSATGDKAEDYSLKLFPNSRLAILSEKQQLFTCQQHGALTATGDRVSSASLFEY